MKLKLWLLTSLLFTNLHSQNDANEAALKRLKEFSGLIKCVEHVIFTRHPHLNINPPSLEADRQLENGEKLVILSAYYSGEARLWLERLDMWKTENTQLLQNKNVQNLYQDIEARLNRLIKKWPKALKQHQADLQQKAQIKLRDEKRSLWQRVAKQAAIALCAITTAIILSKSAINWLRPNR